MAAGEECDDIESWEEMEDSGVLEKKIDKLKAAISTTSQKDLDSSGAANSSASSKQTVVIIAEDGRTRYSAPEPTVKILRRPQMVNSSHNAGGDGFIMNGDVLSGGKPKQPIKTLQQREMEYAEARLRILGEAQSPDERPALLERIRRIQNKTELADGVESSQCVVVDQSPSPGGVGPPINNHTHNVLQSPAHQQQQMIIITSTPPAVVCGSNLIGQYNMVASAHAPTSFNNGRCSKMGASPYMTMAAPLHKAGLMSHQPLAHGGAASCFASGVYNLSQPVPAMYGSAASGGFVNHAAMVAPAIGNGPTNSNAYVTIQSPISLNLAVRQPRGPDGTKGFNNYRNTLR